MAHLEKGVQIACCPKIPKADGESWIPLFVERRVLDRKSVAKAKGVESV